LLNVGDYHRVGDHAAGRSHFEMGGIGGVDHQTLGGLRTGRRLTRA